MTSQIAIGILSVIATIGGALIQRTWRASRPRLPKHEAIEFGAIHESGSFAAQDVVKILDLTGSNVGAAGQPGRAVLTDSYLVRRESEQGNGMVFRYASSGALEGGCISHTDNHVIGTYDSTHLRQSRAISVVLDEIAEGNTVRITNELVYTGAFDRADREDFETHIERPTRSLTIIISFSRSSPCKAVTGQVQVGERGHAESIGKSGPMLTADGTMLYWRVAPKKGTWLPIGAKYRLQWTWVRAAVPLPAVVEQRIEQ